MSNILGTLAGVALLIVLVVGFLFAGEIFAAINASLDTNVSAPLTAAELEAIEVESFAWQMDSEYLAEMDMLINQGMLASLDVIDGLGFPDAAVAPLLPHATRSHARQSWNATTIQALFSMNGCSYTSIHACAGGDYAHPQMKFICNVASNPNIWVGLVVVPTHANTLGFGVLTGYMGPRSYWEMSLGRDHCVPDELPQ